ncbi:MAG: hypothetical protein SPG06_01900 [Eubacteriales bacterium]|nr:hypothetical protein [Eubacteriales bacterium]
MKKDDVYREYKFYTASSDIYRAYKLGIFDMEEVENKVVPIVTEKNNAVVLKKKKGKNTSLLDEIKREDFTNNNAVILKKRENKREKKVRFGVKSNLIEENNLPYFEEIRSEEEKNKNEKIEEFSRISNNSTDRTYSQKTGGNNSFYTNVDDRIYRNREIIDDRSDNGVDNYDAYNGANNGDKNNNTDKIARKGKNSGGKRKKNGVLLVGLFMVAVFMITFFACNFFIPNSWGEDEIDKFYFAVGKTAVTYEDAQSIADAYKAKGGAGFIMESDLFVIADVYKTKEEAESVINNPNNKNAFSEIQTLKEREYCYDYVDKNMLMVVSSALSYVDTAFYDLKRISTGYSQKEIDDIEAKSRIVKVASKLKTIKEMYDDNAVGVANDKVLRLKAQLGATYKQVADLSKSTNLASSIRYVYTSILILHIGLIEDSYLKK